MSTFFFLFIINHILKTVNEINIDFFDKKLVNINFDWKCKVLRPDYLNHTVTKRLKVINSLA